jgi:hypothetical protein
LRHDVAAIAAARPENQATENEALANTGDHMFGTTRGMLVPARKYFAAVTFALIAAAPVAASADPGMVDVRTLPRLENAVEDPARTDSYRVTYGVPTVVAVTSAAAKKLLAADGWVQYVRPLEKPDTSLNFKRGRHGLHVSFTQVLGRPDQSMVYYSADRIFANVPFPDDATDIVFDERRPYLGCSTAASVDASLDFFRRELVAAGWSPLSAVDAAARYPGRMVDEKIGNGVRAFYSRAKLDNGYQQPPIMLSLQHRDDGKTWIEVKVAPFALPEELELAQETMGLPVPNQTPGFGGTGSVGTVRRELEGRIAAEIPAVLAFYRRELAARNWREETRGAVIKADEAVLNFSSPDQNATLRLNYKYDLTILNLVTQFKESALAARAKAKKEADDNFFKDAAAAAKQFIAADETRRVAQAANLSDAPLRALADAATPVPLPESAESLEFDGTVGKFEFNSTSSVKALAAFHRGSLKSLGWKEHPSVINQPHMVVMKFSKGGKDLSMTAMQMGPKVNVSANGSGLVMAAAKTGAAAVQASSGSEAKATAQDLEPEPDSALPVPKQHSMRMMGTGKVPGSDAPFRRDLDASVPADLNAVLAFYRSELGKRGWKEAAEGAVVKPDQVKLAFSASDGPALLKLGRSNGETSINLAQRYPAVAAKANVIPKPGQARLVFGNMGGSEVSLSINKQTIRIAAGAGGPQSPDRPMLDVPAGKYPYSVKVAGRPARSDTIEVTADDAWGVMIAPSGEVLSIQIY